MNIITARRQPWPAPLVQFVVACLVWGQLPVAQAAPAQQPLIKRGDGSVAPNIFYTIDDSGSMGMTYAPSDNTIWPGENTYNNNVNGYLTPVFHPSDSLVAVFGVACYVRTPAATATDGTSVQAMKLRSPDYNKIYYNPGITYKPWARPNPTDANFGDSSITAAPIDPRKIYNNADAGAKSGSINLESAYYSTNNDRWCTNNSYTSASKVALYPATYYRKNGTGFIRVSLGKDENGIAFHTETTFRADNYTPSNKGADRTDCVTLATKCTLAEEKKNFANWYTYYRTRSLLARGASSLAFSKLEDPMRVGYGRINYSGAAADGITGAPTATVQRGVRDFTVNSATRKAFFDWLYTVPASGGTPLRRAMDDVGRYFMVTSTAGPWGNTPGTADTKTTPDPLASCRKSFHILMTDGYWNGAAATKATANYDGSDGPITDIESAYLNKKYRYKKSATDGVGTKSPYADNFSGTLADVAAYYWQTDLFPKVSDTVNLDNNVKANTSKTDTSKPYYSASENVDRGDHAFWQHLTTYTVGLGVAGSIVNTTTAPPATGWPSVTEDSPTAVDDLWHAAVNGRGRYLSAQNPQEFQDAMEAALNAILGSVDANTGVSVSATVVNGSTKRYIPSFNSPSWTGDVKASLLLDPNSNPIWSATDSLPAFGLRKLYTWSGSQVVAFDTSLSTTLRTSMGGATDALINFLRGDRSLEGSTYRCRGDSPGTKVCTAKPANAGLFGDVINGTPILIGKSSADMGYQLLPAADTSRNTYRTYFNAKKARTSAVVAVGANDGMLHFLNDSNGKELMGYIPSTALPNLSRLSYKNYGLSTEDANVNSHRFFVDGPIVEADAYLSGWTNVVIGSAGAGGKSLFAFKVGTSDPTTVSNNSVMWELNAGAQNAQAANLGHVMAPVAVGRMANGKWAAVFGNGLDSTNGTASLWIVDLATGEPLVAPIRAGTETGNGLGGVTLVRNAQRVVVAAYAGDALGRMWRFDLEGASASNWKVGFGGSPLIATGKAITAAPTYLSHPKGGLMVLFGTGKLYANGDEATTTQQSLYGVWDVTAVGKASVAGRTASLSKLVQPRVNTSVTVKAVGSPLKGYAIDPSSTTISYTDYNGLRGWVLDMAAATGERAIYNPFLLQGYAYFNTMAPQVATQGDPCISQSSNFWQYTINPFTGEMPQFSLYDTNGDGVINDKDTRISVTEVPGDGLGPGTPLITCVGASCKCEGPGCQTCVGDSCPKEGCTPGATNCLSSEGCSGQSAGVAYSSGNYGICGPGLTVQRTWRQILNFPKSTATGN